ISRQTSKQGCANGCWEILVNVLDREIMAKRIAARQDACRIVGFPRRIGQLHACKMSCLLALLFVGGLRPQSEVSNNACFCTCDESRKGRECSLAARSREAEQAARMRPTLPNRQFPVSIRPSRSDKPTRGRRRLRSQS